MRHAVTRGIVAGYGRITTIPLTLSIERQERLASWLVAAT